MAEPTNESTRPQRQESGRAGGGDRSGRSSDRRGGPGGGSDRRGGGRRRRFHRGKPCQFCINKVVYIDYKDLERLRYYVSDTGKILPRRQTGNCARHQRMASKALKRARHLALLPYRVT